VAIRVECPKCNQTLEAPDEIAGRAAICPTCRTKVQIPPTPANDVLTPVPTPQPAEPKPRQAKSADRIESIVSDVRAELRTLNSRIGCLIVLFLIAAIIGIAAIILFNRATQLYLPISGTSSAPSPYRQRRIGSEAPVERYVQPCSHGALSAKIVDESPQFAATVVSLTTGQQPQSQVPKRPPQPSNASASPSTAPVAA
jgi:hypothetical protein